MDQPIEDSHPQICHQEPYYGPNIELFFEEDAFADVCFEFPFGLLVIEGQKRLPCHKIMLSMRSQKLYQRFINKWSNMENVTVKVYSYTAFRQFVRFLYTNRAFAEHTQLDDLLQMSAIAGETG